MNSNKQMTEREAALLLGVVNSFKNRGSSETKKKPVRKKKKKTHRK